LKSGVLSTILVADGLPSAHKDIMRIFKLKDFDKWSKQLVTDENLSKAVDEIGAGKYDASLGGKVYKQRVATGNAGKSGATRTIIAFQQKNKAFFFYGFEKGDRANITSKDLKAFKKLAETYLALSDEGLKVALKAKEIVEIKSE
jgi:hypothetical protein